MMVWEGDIQCAKVSQSGPFTPEIFALAKALNF